MDTPTRDTTWSGRMALYEPSRAVTEILDLAERPDVISLAGGLPDPAIFPLDRVRECMERVLRDEGSQALNYGPNPGFSKLREWVSERMGTVEGVTLEPSNILIASGGVEGLNLAAMAMVDKGDTVLVEAPTYMMALHVFRTYEARIVSVHSDVSEGLDPEALRETLERLSSEGTRPKMLYVIPSFQNPSGATLSQSRREEVVALCRRYGVPIVEDHAYAELSYDAPPLPSLKALDPENVIFIHTFSKIFGPGVRLGFVAAESELIERFGLCKLGTDQCANTLTQRLVYEYGRHGFIEQQVAASRELYRRKRDRMESALASALPEDASFQHPSGGFFLWVKLADGADSEAILAHAIEREKTAFVAGTPFFDGAGGRDTLRLSFSFVPESQIDEAVSRLARAITD